MAHGAGKDRSRVGGPGEVVGAVLAGGQSRRLGTVKALAKLGDQPLINYPLAALRDAFGSSVVVAKSGVSLDELDVEVWLDDRPERHPIVGVLTALRCANAGRVFLSACDTPFASAELALRVAGAAPDASVTVAVTDGVVQPLFAVYSPRVESELAQALDRSLPLTEAVAGMDPYKVSCPAELLFNVNTPEDLEEAERKLKEGLERNTGSKEDGNEMELGS